MVKVYSRGSCGPCRTLKYWLDKKRVEYEEHDLDKEPELARKLNIMAVPCVVVGTEVVVGLNLTRLADLLT